MQSTPRRAIAPLAAVLALLLAGCGGAGYGDPIAATDGGGTTALAPAPVTTPGDPTAGATGSAGGASSTGGGAPATDAPDGGSSAGDAGGTSSGGGNADGGAGDDSGSGGDDGGTAASVAAYASDANRFCTGFKDATRSLASEIAAAGSDTAGVGRAIVRYGQNVQDAATGLRAAPVPDVAATYHRRTLAWVSGVSSAISGRRSGLENGQQSAGAAVIREVQGLGQPPLGSQVPSALRARATACRT